ncbi:MAG TPA: alpha-E domain-containing protein [Methylomirabilota bacterium]|nr:alpha-E domain-containing protein [Methylomirabilota bacterium]
MILSRVADALYWMGRYLERAENVTRLVLVTEEMSTEVVGLDEDLARAEWNDLRAIFPGADGEAAPPLADAAALAEATLHGLSIDPRHPSSTLFSLKKARDNARTVREALTIEVFVNLNETYRTLENADRAQLADVPTFRDSLAATHRGILSTSGAIEQTLARDPGWLFLKLGETLERVFRTTRVLRVKLPALSAREPTVDLPLFYSRWRGLLRGLSSLENYRKVHGARMEPADALQFLLFDPHTPRSVRYGTAAVKELLERISGGTELSLPARVMGKLAAELAYQGHEVLHDGRCLPFLDHVLEELRRCHDTLSTTYFGT